MHSHAIWSCRKSLNTSRALNTGWASTTSWVWLDYINKPKPWIVAGPQIQAGFQKLVQLVSLLSKHLCNVFWAKHMVTCCLPSFCCNADVLIQAWVWLVCTNRSRGLLFKDLCYLYLYLYSYISRWWYWLDEMIYLCVSWWQEIDWTLYMVAESDFYVIVYCSWGFLCYYVLVLALLIICDNYHIS